MWSSFTDLVFLKKITKRNAFSTSLVVEKEEQVETEVVKSSHDNGDNACGKRRRSKRQRDPGLPEQQQQTTMKCQDQEAHAEIVSKPIRDTEKDADERQEKEEKEKRLFSSQRKMLQNSHQDIQKIEEGGRGKDREVLQEPSDHLGLQPQVHKVKVKVEVEKYSADFEDSNSHTLNSRQRKRLKTKVPPIPDDAEIIELE